MTTTPYKKELADQNYDVLVIGSGIGGLGAAALLAKQGQRVLVLERHYVAGGFTHTFTRKGYEWDVGLHYIGEVHREKSVLRRLFDYISEGELKWQYMPEVYDKIYFGDEYYPYVAGAKNFKAQLLKSFPEEEGAIDSYFNAVFTAAGAARGFFSEKALPNFIGALASPFLRRKFLSYSDRTTYDVVSSFTKNEKLIGVLTAQYGDYGLPPKKSSFAIHAMVAKHYFDGGNYPIGGSSRIAETIIPVIEKSGGRVLVKADVKEIIVQNGIATGVKMANGDFIAAKKIVSDAGVINTFKHMLSDEVRKKYSLDKNLAQVTPSLAHICLYAGIKESSASLNLGQANYWIYPGPNHDESIENYLQNPNGPLPVTYISFPSAKDPTWSERYPSRSTIEIVGFTPYAWFKKWEGTSWMKRGDDYKAYKEELAQRLLENLYKYVPAVKGKIDYYELSTPLSTASFCNYQEGEIYGSKSLYSQLV